MNTLERKTFQENMSILSDYIMKAIEMAEPYEWTEWDVFTGRQIHQKQSLREAQKQSVEKFLTNVFKDEK